MKSTSFSNSHLSTLNVHSFSNTPATTTKNIMSYGTSSNPQQLFTNTHGIPLLQSSSSRFQQASSQSCSGPSYGNRKRMVSAVASTGNKPFTANTSSDFGKTSVVEADPLGLETGNLCGTIESLSDCKISKDVDGGKFVSDTNEDGTPVSKVLSSLSASITDWSSLTAGGSAAMSILKRDGTQPLQRVIESSLSSSSTEKISAVLEEVQRMTELERLLLYTKLPTTSTPHASATSACAAASGSSSLVGALADGSRSGTLTDSLKHLCNPLGSRAEIQLTVNWIRTHLTLDPETSMPKREVYHQYQQFCAASNIKALSTADFGKVMKQVFPNVRPRRLGHRGESKYCYSGLRQTDTLADPVVPDLFEDEDLTTHPSKYWWTNAESSHKASVCRLKPAPSTGTCKTPLQDAAQKVVLQWANTVLSTPSKTAEDSCKNTACNNNGVDTSDRRILNNFECSNVKRSGEDSKSALESADIISVGSRKTKGLALFVRNSLNSKSSENETDVSTASEFSSLVDLADHLVTAKLVDCSTSHASLFVASSSQSQTAGVTRSALTLSSGGHREATRQLARKLQDRDQKRKLQETSPRGVAAYSGLSVTPSLVSSVQETGKQQQKMRRRSTSISNNNTSAAPTSGAALPSTPGHATAVTSVASGYTSDISSGYGSTSSSCLNSAGSSTNSSRNPSGDNTVPHAASSSLLSCSTLNHTTIVPSSTVSSQADIPAQPQLMGFKHIIDEKPTPSELGICMEQMAESSQNADKDPARSSLVCSNNFVDGRKQQKTVLIISTNSATPFTSHLTQNVRDGNSMLLSSCKNTVRDTHTSDNLGSQSSKLLAPNSSTQAALSSCSQEISAQEACSDSVNTSKTCAKQDDDVNTLSNEVNLRNLRQVLTYLVPDSSTGNFSQHRDSSLARPACALGSRGSGTTTGEWSTYALPREQICVNNGNVRSSLQQQQMGAIPANALSEALNNCTVNSNCGTSNASATTSPFTSPQMTPLCSRSRNNSGQASTYLTPRSTPCNPEDGMQTLGHSSFSSTASTTPFMSPMRTPAYVRSRNNSQNHRTDVTGGPMNHLHPGAIIAANTFSVGACSSSTPISSSMPGLRSRHSSGPRRLPYQVPDDHSHSQYLQANHQPSRLQQRRLRSSSGGCMSGASGGGGVGGTLTNSGGIHSAPLSPLIDGQEFYSQSHMAQTYTPHVQNLGSFTGIAMGRGGVHSSDYRRRHTSAGPFLHHPPSIPLQQNQLIGQPPAAYISSAVQSCSSYSEHSIAPLNITSLNDSGFISSNSAAQLSSCSNTNRPQSVPLPDMIANGSYSFPQLSVPNTPLLHYGQQTPNLQGGSLMNPVGRQFSFDSSLSPSNAQTPVPSECADFVSDCCGDLTSSACSTVGDIINSSDVVSNVGTSFAAAGSDLDINALDSLVGDLPGLGSEFVSSLSTEETQHCSESADTMVSSSSILPVLAIHSADGASSTNVQHIKADINSRIATDARIMNNSDTFENPCDEGILENIDFEDLNLASGGDLDEGLALGDAGEDFSEEGAGCSGLMFSGTAGNRRISDASCWALLSPSSSGGGGLQTQFSPDSLGTPHTGGSMTVSTRVYNARTSDITLNQLNVSTASHHTNVPGASISNSAVPLEPSSSVSDLPSCDLEEMFQLSTKSSNLQAGELDLDG